ncbi:MAG: (Fe-S)-binding protein [Cyclobacteriaceae bacterium]
MGKSLKENIDSSNSDTLNSCVHCGLCLSDCPTYNLTGDEANSPRGRLHLWKAEKEGRLSEDSLVDFYTDECVGCLACETACPSNVPYGQFLEERRRKQVVEGRNHVHWKIRVVGKLIKQLSILNLLTLPIRILRMMGMKMGLIFPGDPAIFESSYSYADRLRKQYKPSGPEVALLTGCLMEGVFREINFATIQVLMRNNINVIIPEGQGCCGAIYEHTGLEDPNELFEQNRKIFLKYNVDMVLSNSSGCGLALSKALTGTNIRVKDVVTYLGELNLNQPSKKSDKIKLFVDLPCHLIHGQREAGIPASVLDATGYEWELAPGARDCCGSGGSYNIQKPDNAREIIKGKSEFLNSIPDEIYPIIVTSNHVCMMQWKTAKELIRRPFEVKHLMELL